MNGSQAIANGICATLAAEAWNHDLSRYVHFRSGGSSPSPQSWTQRETAQAGNTYDCGCIASLDGGTYNVLSGMPQPFRMPPVAAAKIIEQMRDRVRLVGLTETEYAATIESVAEHGLSGGIVYDALEMRCARKAGATRIYSWNARHFRLVDFEMAKMVYFP